MKLMFESAAHPLGSPVGCWLPARSIRFVWTSRVGTCCALLLNFRSSWHSSYGFEKWSISRQRPILHHRFRPRRRGHGRLLKARSAGPRTKARSKSRKRSVITLWDSIGIRKWNMNVAQMERNGTWRNTNGITTEHKWTHTEHKPNLNETQKVFDFVKNVRESGRSVLFIGHNIYHVYDISDRFVILDRGEVVHQLNKKDVKNPEELMRIMRDIVRKH